jgi:hypothetical protein
MNLRIATAFVGSCLVGCHAGATVNPSVAADPTHQAGRPAESPAGRTETRPGPDAPRDERRRLPDTQPATPSLRSIALNYESWFRVDEWNRWAPELCAVRPAQARISADEAVHGGKLYYLYAKYRDAFVDGIDKPQPQGQVIVKESFHAVELGANEKVDEVGRLVGIPQGPYGVAVAEKDGKRWRPGKPYALFMMIKGRESDPDADRGWRYATTSMDGKTVYTNGRVASCMECHARAPHDRLFGLQK